MTRESKPSPDLAWLVAALWGGQGIRTEVTRSATGVAGESYAIVPSARRARFLLPAESPRAAEASLRSYNRLRPPRVRMARTTVALASRLGMRRLASRDVLRVSYSEPARSLAASLREVLRTDDVHFAVGLPPRGPNRKPVLQVFSSRGRPLAFVKVGWNDVTRARVAKESEALAGWPHRPRGLVRVPRLLHQGPWGDLQISVSAPLPLDVGRYPVSRGLPLGAVKEVWDAGDHRSEELGPSSYLEDLRARCLALDDARRREALVRLVDMVGERFGEVVVSFADWHGDWVPWNLACGRDVLYVFDWEHHRRDVPVGLDILHWHFQLAFVVAQRPLGRAWGEAEEPAARDLARVGVSERASRAVARLYLVEMALRAAESVAVGGTPNPRWEGSIDALLTGLATR